jgi:hypothetical protein
VALDEAALRELIARERAELRARAWRIGAASTPSARRPTSAPHGIPAVGPLARAVRPAREKRAAEARPVLGCSENDRTPPGLTNADPPRYEATNKPTIKRILIAVAIVVAIAVVVFATGWTDDRARPGTTGRAPVTAAPSRTSP